MFRYNFIHRHFSLIRFVLKVLFIFLRFSFILLIRNEKYNRINMFNQFSSSFQSSLKFIWIFLHIEQSKRDSRSYMLLKIIIPYNSYAYHWTESLRVYLTVSNDFRAIVTNKFVHLIFFGLQHCYILPRYMNIQRCSKFTSS